MLPEELAFMSAVEVRDRIRRRELSPVEAVETYLRRIERLDPRLRAFLTVNTDESLAEARRAEQAVARGEPLGPLHGVPVPVKDLTLTRGLRTTFGSLIFKDYVPTEDEPVVARIRAAGGIVMGKTNTPEFGHRATTENRLGEPCRNPWDISRTPGGSSGGAAAALAAGLCPVATGTDAGGSIRIPAGFTGIYGIKPSQGRVARPKPSPGPWRPFSQEGPMSRTVADAALLLQVMAGPHPSDPTSLQGPVPDFVSAARADVRGLRIAWDPDWGGQAPVDPEVRALTEAATRSFADMGASLEQAGPRIELEKVRQAFYALFMADYVVTLRQHFERRPELLTGTLRDWLADALNWTVDAPARAMLDMEWHRFNMARFFERRDLLLTPTLAVPAFPIGQWPEVIDGKAVDPAWGFTPFSYPINVSGGTAASVPCGLTRGGLPVGLQIIGAPGAEGLVLRASAAFEEAHPWAGLRPPIA